MAKSIFKKLLYYLWHTLNKRGKTRCGYIYSEDTKVLETRYTREVYSGKSTSKFNYCGMDKWEKAETWEGRVFAVRCVCMLDSQRIYIICIIKQQNQNIHTHL